MYDNPYNSLAWMRGIEKGNLILGENLCIGTFCVIDGEHDTVNIGNNVDIISGSQVTKCDTV